MEHPDKESTVTDYERGYQKGRESGLREAAHDLELVTLSIHKSKPDADEAVRWLTTLYERTIGTADWLRSLMAHR